MQVPDCQFIQAAGEAEQQMVSLLNDGKVTMCLSTDADLFLLGCAKVITTMDFSKDRYIEVDNIDVLVKLYPGILGSRMDDIMQTTESNHGILFTLHRSSY